jgi:hypothetical protein
MRRAQDHKRARKRVAVTKNHGIVGREVEFAYRHEGPEPSRTRVATAAAGHAGLQGLALYPYFSRDSHLIGSELLSEIPWHL